MNNEDNFAFAMLMIATAIGGAAFAMIGTGGGWAAVGVGALFAILAFSFVCDYMS